MGVFDLLGTSKKARQKLEEGVVHLDKKEAAEALACFEEAVKFDPKNAECWFQLGSARSALKKREEAIKDFSEAIRLNPAHALAFGTRGLMKVQLGRFSDAVADFNDAIRLKPDMAMAYYNLGSARFKLEQYEEALQDYAQALKLYRQHPGIWYASGKAKEALGKKEEAAADFSEAIKLDPKNHKAYFRRGTLFYGMGRLREALADLDKAAEMEPHNPWVRFHRGNARARVGLKEESIQDYDEAVRILPKNAMAYYNRGNSLFSLKRYKEAIDDYNKALKLDSTLSVAYYSRSTARMLAGERDQAVKDLDIFVQMSENSVGGSQRMRDEALRYLEALKKSGTGEIKMPDTSETTVRMEAIKDEEAFKTMDKKLADGIKEQKFEAILFIDICKSTNLIDSYGELHYFQKVQTAVDNPLGELKKRHACQYEKGTGDGYMLTFNDCASAVNLAVSLMLAMEQHNATLEDQTQRVDLRIGIDCGQVIVKELDNDRIGDAANVAKRIEGLMQDAFVEFAEGSKEAFREKNRVYCSAKVMTMLGDAPHIKRSEVGWAELKGKIGVRYQIHEVLWEKSQPGSGGHTLSTSVLKVQ